MKNIIHYFLKGYSSSDFKNWSRIRVLIILDLLGILLTLVQLGVNISSQVHIDSVARKIILPLLMSLLFFLNLFIIKYNRKKYFAGNVLVISLLIIHLSFLSYYAPSAHFTYFVSGFYHALLFYALSAIIGSKRVLFFNTLVILIGFNISYYRALPEIEPVILNYAKTAYINFQIIIIALGIILFSGRWLTDKAMFEMQISKNESQSYAQKLELLFQKIKLVVTDLLNISGDIASKTEIISTAASQQASNIEEITSTLEQNTVSLAETASNSEATEKFSFKTEQFVEKNLTNFLETAESIKAISEQSSKIDEIAGKTEILAINAAIEAARNKNSGQGGFSVISSEIKKLAEKSQATSRYIKDLIKVSTKLSFNSNENIIEIKKLVSELDERIQQMAYASQEQKISMQQISLSTNVINDVAQKNAAISEEFSDIVKNLMGNADQLNQLLKDK